MVPELDFGDMSVVQVFLSESWKRFEKFHDGSVVFTDGFKMEIGIRAGDYIVDSSIRMSYRLQAEFIAILKATELVRCYIERDRKVTFHEDSQAALKLCWVLGHSSVNISEITDELARHGTEWDRIMEVESLSKPIGYFHRELHLKNLNRIKIHWKGAV